MSHAVEELDKQITEAKKKVEVCVIYRALYGKSIVWVRTVENFLEKVDKNVYRFSKVI